MSFTVLKVFQNILSWIMKLFLGMIVFIVALMIVMINIRYYDYGIDKGEVTLAYPSFFPSKEYLDHNFSTVLLTKEGTFSRQSDALIYIEHLKKPLVGPLKEMDVRVTDVVFNVPPESFSIDKIVLVHKIADGKILRPTNNNMEEFLTCIKTSKNRCIYRQVYENSELSEKMVEHILIEYTIDGKKYDFSKKYPIEKAYHYSLWDILMGV